MIVQCAWCKKHMGEIEPLSSTAVSHGICPKCLDEQMKVAKKVTPMRNAPKKGSPEAFAWARRMQAARDAKNRRPHPGRAFHVYDTVTRKIVESYPSSLEAFASIKSRGVSRKRFRVVDEEMGYVRNPGASYHAQEAELAEQQERRAARGGRMSQAAFQRGKAAAHRQSEMKARELKENPIVVFGNPGSRVQAKVEGVIYNRCIEIRAEKTHHKPGLYRHPFAKKSRAVILGLDNGSILIHSMAGERLWGEDTDL